jgi:hypothetical protein
MEALSALSIFSALSISPFLMMTTRSTASHNLQEMLELSLSHILFSSVIVESATLSSFSISPEIVTNKKLPFSRLISAVCRIAIQG